MLFGPTRDIGFNLRPLPAVQRALSQRANRFVEQGRFATISFWKYQLFLASAAHRRWRHANYQLSPGQILADRELHRVTKPDRDRERTRTTGKRRSERK